MIASPELLAARALEAPEVRRVVQQIVDELRQVGEAKAAAIARSYHRPLPDVTLSRTQLELAYQQAKVRPHRAANDA